MSPWDVIPIATALVMVDVKVVNLRATMVASAGAREAAKAIVQ